MVLFVHEFSIDEFSIGLDLFLMNLLISRSMTFSGYSFSISVFLTFLISRSLSSVFLHIFHI